MRRGLFTAWYGKKSFVASTELGKATITFVTPICLSVCHHGKIRISPEGLLLNLKFENFSKICRGNFKIY